MDRKKQSFEMAQMLKQLREERKLSHKSLAEELQSKYHINISKDSLINYEICDENRSKSDNLANMKMRVEFLDCLATFYGVSTDYLLGKTVKKTPDISVRGASECTGLSETAIEKVQSLSNPETSPSVARINDSDGRIENISINIIFNHLIESDLFQLVIASLAGAILFRRYAPVDGQLWSDWNNGTKETNTDAMRSASNLVIMADTLNKFVSAEANLLRDHRNRNTEN